MFLLTFNNLADFHVRGETQSFISKEEEEKKFFYIKGRVIVFFRK